MRSSILTLRLVVAATVSIVAAAGDGTASDGKGADDAAVVGHWPLVTSTDDVSAQKHPTRVHHVSLIPGATGDKDVSAGGVFNGRDSWLEVPSSKGLNFGKGDFSIAGWVETGA